MTTTATLTWSTHCGVARVAQAGGTTFFVEPRRSGGWRLRAVSFGADDGMQSVVTTHDTLGDAQAAAEAG